MNNASQETWPDEPCDEDRNLLLGLSVLVGVETVIIGAIMLAVGASALVTAGMILLAVGILICTLWLCTMLMWRPMQRRYPSRPIEPDAISRTWQSVAFGWVSRFNHCLRVTADSQHLHIHPFLVFRWFGARRISLPWDQFTNVRPGVLGMTHAHLDGRRISAPSWAMQLANAEA